MEKLTTNEYEEWKSFMERLVYHPKKQKAMDLIKKYRKPLAKQSILDEMPPITIEQDGRKTVHVKG